MNLSEGERKIISRKRKLKKRCMPAIESIGPILCVRGGIDEDISFFVAKGLNPYSRDAGRSEDGACFRL